MRTRSFFITTLLSLWAGHVWADAPAVATSTEAVKPWKNSTEASFVTTNGNSKTTTTSAKDTFGYHWGLNTLELMGLALGSSAGNDVTAENYSASEKVTRNFTAANYVYQKFTWDKDRFAGISDRYDAEVGLGRELINTTPDKLNLELGPGYVNEDRINSPRNDYASARAFTKYVHNFNATTLFSQTVEYVTNVSDSNDFRINTESAIVVAISSHLSFKSSFLWKRVNEPPVNTLKNDTTTSLALIVNY